MHDSRADDNNHTIPCHIGDTYTAFLIVHACNFRNIYGDDDASDRAGDAPGSDGFQASDDQNRNGVHTVGRYKGVREGYSRNNRNDVALDVNLDFIMK